MRYNYTLGAYIDDENYGFGKLHVHNASHIQWQFIRSEDEGLDDELWIVQKKNLCVWNAQCTTQECGSSDRCCKDERLGEVCYNPVSFCYSQFTKHRR